MNSIGELIGDANSFLKSPLKSSPYDIALIVLIVGIAAFLWTRVLAMLEEFLE